MNDLFHGQNTGLEGPVECLGQKFQSDEARRQHYLAILREKLKDTAFRKIEGFPIGTDEDILALSDPPYYTACPNPWIADLFAEWDELKSNGPNVKQIHREPFVADVSEGKYDPIYRYHPYPTKVPHKAIMRYILHYTEPGDIVFDGFCGTGMTGVAAQLCGDREAVISLGYKVESNGSISQQEIDETNTKYWRKFSRLGARRVVLNDLSPAATFISYNYNTPVDLTQFESEANQLIKQIEKECGWMYETKHVDGRTGIVNYAVWSDVFSCPECVGEIVFWDSVVIHDEGKVKEQFSCPHCDALLTKRMLERVWESSSSNTHEGTQQLAKQIPVMINYSIGSSRYQKKPDQFDQDLLKKLDEMSLPYWFPNHRMIEGKETRRNDPMGITHVHHFYTRRNLYVLASLKSKIKNPRLNLLITKVAFQITKLYRFTYQSGVWGAGGGPLSGTLYVPSLIKDLNIIKQIKDALKQRRTILLPSFPGYFAGSTQSSTSLKSIPKNSVNYVFIDPPFGSNLYYSELASLWEAWLRVSTNNVEEAIENDSHKKGLNEYRLLIQKCLTEVHRILKPGGWMTVEFSNTKASVWNAIQTALQEAGFVVANVAALDKQKGSFKAVTTTTAVKQDLVISAYKPNGGLEERFGKAGGSEDSAWDFVRTHLKYLPTVKLKDGQIEFVAERDPRIIFDRLVAWFVRHSFPVPLSSQEFQAGLSQRFAERDGMVFLPEQVTEYDKKRMQIIKAPQMEMFIADERSAIDWLTDFLKKKPSTYQEVHPEFIKQLGAGWKKHEAKPELSYLLESNFLCYDPKDKDGIEVPSQIHSYLSTNWPEFRNLEKSDPRLKAKATERWFVPDPSKARDLEMIRDKALLKEFETYRSFAGRRLKTFRLEAMRTGFKTAWANKDYATIIAVAQKLPEEALQEDEKLLLWYDQALTRTEAGA